MTHDLLSELLAEPVSLTEVLHGRPPYLRIFVSSKMRNGVYVAERRLCARAIDKTGLFRSWIWENDANAGPYCSEAVCLRHAATVDGLILIVGDELTEITRKEYAAAHGRGAPTFVFVDQRETQNEQVRAFIQSVRDSPAVTKSFANLAELEAAVLAAIGEMNSLSWRSQAHAAHQRRRGEAA